VRIKTEGNVDVSVRRALSEREMGRFHRARGGGAGMSEEHVNALLELESPDHLQQVLAALWLLKEAIACAKRQPLESIAH
jgi:hypothetical protein